MDNEIWSRISGALGQVPGRAANVAGLGLDTIATINALAGNPAQAIQFLQAQAAAQQDPTLRSIAMQSPFQAGLMGLGVHSLPSAGTSTELTRAGFSPEQARGMGVEVLGPGEAAGASRLGPVLPPLLPAARASQALASAKERLILAEPERVARAELGMGEDFSTLVGRIPAFQALADTFPGIQIRQDTKGGVSIGTTPHRTFTLDEANASAHFLQSQGLRTAVAPDPRGGYGVRASWPPQSQQQADPALLRALGLIPPETPQGQPQVTPTTPQGQLGASPQQPVMLPPGVIPVPGSGAIAAPAEGTIGFPPPASGARPIAPTPLVPPAPKRALSPLKPGQRVSAKIGGIAVSQSGGPMSKEDFSQIASQRVLPLLQGAKNAIQILRNAGVLTDDLRGVALNGQRMNVVGRLAGVNLNDPGVVNSIVGSGLHDLVGLDPSVLQNPDVTAAAAFVARNLRSAVPLIARGFGEQRTNFREEQRLADALSFSGTSATGAEQIIDNYVQLFSTGQSPGLPGASLDNMIKNWASDPSVLAPLSGATGAPQSSPTIHYRPEQ